ncbi:MAG TPA: ABC transporter permease [Thermoflexia bacterium]|jgi:peptide/nickel transport system permease protein|nr:ABC transporter permease [Thermoflexia bacterium]
MVWRRFRRHPGALAGLIVLSILVLGVALIPLSPYDPDISNIPDRLQPPSREHPFGTDPLGRDLFTRVFYGGRISLSVGLMVVAITLFIGVPVGAISGYFGGWVDNVLMRITDAFLCLPSLLVLILLSAILREVELPLLHQNSVVTISLVIGLLSWMPVARLVRASFLAIREQEFVLAAQSVGASDLRIIVRHILPNAAGPIIVESTLEMAYAIMEESGLSFLGFGIQPPTPSWGNLLGDAQQHMTKYPWVAIFPGLMIFLTIIAINYVGDGLRDALDPFKILKRIGEV